MVAIGTDTLVALYYYILFSAMSDNRGDRCLYSLTIDLALVTKYRKKIIDKGILERLQEIVANTCEPG
ncbi:MAG: transposase [Cyanobacteria bacterium LVE1205-1]